MDSDRLPTRVAKVRDGDRAARDRPCALVYDDLPCRARFELARAGRASLDPPAVGHEAYPKLGGASRTQPEDRGHFIPVAVRALRGVMLERARERPTTKRGGAPVAARIESVEAEVGSEEPTEELSAPGVALSRPEERGERLAHVVQPRDFAGRAVEETAATPGLSARTVKRNRRPARACLYAECAEGPTTNDEAE